MRLGSLACLTVVLVLSGAQPAAAQSEQTPSPTAQPTINAALQDALTAAGEPVSGIGPDERAILQSFYSSRGYAPLWSAASGLLPPGSQILATLERIKEAGPATARPLIEAAQIEPAGDRPMQIAQREVLLSAALIRSAVDPDDLTRSSQGAAALAAVAAAPDTPATLRVWLPPAPEFWRLRDAVQRYRAMESAGGWPEVPAGPKLVLGAQDDRVPVLRSRLEAEGDLTETAPDPRVFDASLEAAVQRFQERHGLAADGVVGRGTIEAMNVPVRTRIKSMLLNLARLHDRPWADERRNVVVNVAGASYRLMDDDQLIFERRTIVGQKDWPTPLLDSEIIRLEFNPYWYVPPRITELELQPHLDQDPDYLARNAMYLIDGVYRQDPGPHNPLGVVKFLFPNRYSVYLHDTNKPQLFERPDRFLSHGCVRLSNARDLASYLLKDDSTWDAARQERVIAAGKTRTVMLTRPLPIHIVYLTAWVDDAGRVNFRKDVYGYDH